MKIWNKLNLLVIGLIISILPTFATPNWVQIDKKMYIDTNSIRKENYLNSSYGNYYSLWAKWLNDGSKNFLDDENYYKTKMWFRLIQYYYDCNNKTLALKSGVFYDLKGNPIQYTTLKDYNLSFISIVPGSIGDKMYDYVCTGRF